MVEEIKVDGSKPTLQEQLLKRVEALELKHTQLLTALRKGGYIE